MMAIQRGVEVMPHKFGSPGVPVFGYILKLLADYVIDMGPEGGLAGGMIVAKGTPEDIAKVADSFTGQYLKTMLK